MNNNETGVIIPAERIERLIYVIRGRKVILDQDLAMLYGVETKNFNKAAGRNKERFPEDFAFQLTKEEWNALRFQFGTSNVGRGGRRYLPFVFTEHGVVMAANLLKSDMAITVSVEIVRAFIRMRHFLASQEEIIKDLAGVKSFVLKHSSQNDREFRRVWQAIEKLMSPPKAEPEHRIGFDLNQ
jgi:hypothetical protein